MDRKARLALSWAWVAGLALLALAWAALAAFGWAYTAEPFVDDGGCYPGSPGFAWTQAAIAAAGVVAVLVASAATVRFARAGRGVLPAALAHAGVIVAVIVWIAVVANHTREPAYSWIQDDAECSEAGA